MALLEYFKGNLPTVKTQEKPSSCVVSTDRAITTNPTTERTACTAFTSGQRAAMLLNTATAAVNRIQVHITKKSSGIEIGKLKIAKVPKNANQDTVLWTSTPLERCYATHAGAKWVHVNYFRPCANELGTNLLHI